MRRAEHAALIGKERNVCRVLKGKPERKETTRKTKAEVGGWDQNGC
jgi:hypothetical protein